MDYQEAMARLEAAGTAQNRKVYGRHGVAGAMFGVSYAEQRKLAREIKRDHDLARRLWASGNHDARVLAAMVADPGETTAQELDAWAADCDSYVLTDALSGLAAKTRHARAKAEGWGASPREHTAQAGWNLVASLAMTDDALPDSYFTERLATLEREIHDRPNRVRHAMNQALIAIGVRNPALEKRALAAAARIGRVEVDHGETGCNTPDAAGYIRRTLEHRRAKAAKKAKAAAGG